MARTGTTSRLAAGLAAAAVLAAGGGGFAAGRTSGADEPAAADDHAASHEPGSVEAIAEQLAADQERDRAALAEDLSAAAETAHGQLGEALRGMAAAVPVADAGGPAAVPAPAAQAARWAALATRAEQGLSAVGEGTSELTVTREALRGAAALLAEAATAYARAGATGSVDAEALAPVAQRRDDAVRLWQAGAAQLDTVVVEAGLEHVHLFLDPSGDPDAVPLEFREPDAP